MLEMRSSVVSNALFVWLAENQWIPFVPTAAVNWSEGLDERSVVDWVNRKIVRVSG
jgi:hypothetical protein